MLNGGTVGDYRCAYVNVEQGQTAREDMRRGMHAILYAIALGAESALSDDFVARTRRGALDEAGPENALAAVLMRWSQANPRPLVLLVDEIDALVGDTLLAVLHQLRSGCYLRPERFPHSIVLCGVRDVRDYRIHSSAQDATIAGGSAFNINAKSLRLGDFTRHEVETLLAQHTAETGQNFTEGARKMVWEHTQGQPCLVNALCDQACDESARGRNRRHDISEDDILEAREQLVLQRAAPLDQLADKLQQARVRRVVEPTLSGSGRDNFSDRDLEYARDLGLVARDGPIRIANPIYREVVPRQLTWGVQERMRQEAAWYVGSDGNLDLSKLLGAFQQYHRENSEFWIGRFDYRECGPQLLLQAFLQRVVNGGGRIDREFALGAGRTDLLVTWPCGERVQRFAIKRKVRSGKSERVIAMGPEFWTSYN